MQMIEVRQLKAKKSVVLNSNQSFYLNAIINYTRKEIK